MAKSKLAHDAIAVTIISTCGSPVHVLVCVCLGRGKSNRLYAHKRFSSSTNARQFLLDHVAMRNFHVRFEPCEIPFIRMNKGKHYANGQ